MDVKIMNQNGADHLSFNGVENLCYHCMNLKDATGACSICHNQEPPANPKNALAIGTILRQRYIVGPFLVKDEIGLIYHGYDKEQRQKIAIFEYLLAGQASRSLNGLHVLPPIDEEENECYVSGLRYFIKEAGQLSDFYHENAIQIHNFFSENNTGYMIMESIEGRLLQDYLSEKGGRLEEEDAISLMSPIIDALSVLHKYNMCHWNLSPQTILIDQDNTPQLFCFGFAKRTLIEMHPRLNRLLKHGYAAPELYNMNKKSGPTADVYACGALLYYLVSGNAPKEAKSRQKTKDLASLLQSDIPVTRKFNHAIMKSLALSPNRRFKTILDLKKALKWQFTIAGTSIQRLLVISLSTICIALSILLGGLHILSTHPTQVITALHHYRTWVHGKTQTSNLSSPGPQMDGLSGISFNENSDKKALTPTTGLSQSTIKKPPMSKETINICVPYLMTSLTSELMKSFIKLKCENFHSFKDSPYEQRLTCQTINALLTIQMKQKLPEQDLIGLIEKNCDIVITTHKISKQEMARLNINAGGDSLVKDYRIGMDGLAIIVHPSNPIRQIPLNYVTDILKSKITHWSTISAINEKITVYAPFDCLIDEQNASLTETNDSQSVVRLSSHQSVVDHVASNPFGIGCVSMPFIKNAQDISVFDHDAIPLRPTFFTVATKDYPLTRYIYLYTSFHANRPLMNEFIQFVYSDSGQDVIKQSGFVDLAVKAISSWQYPKELAKNLAVFQKYEQATQNAQRLSVNFHFQKGSFELEDMSLNDIKRVIQYLKNLKENKQIILIGFSDSKGAYQYNCMLALKRARALANELRSSGVHVDEVITACEEIPIASNETEEGQDKNRRVEIWIR